VVGGGAGIGAAAGPIDVDGEAEHATHTAEAADGVGAGEGAGAADALPGYRLDVPTAALPAGERSTLAFRVVDDAGDPVVRDAVEEEERLDLVVVGRNLVDYAHVHPTLGDDGTWRVRLPALPAGSYRAFADLRPTGGDTLTLAADLVVGGATPPSEVTADDVDTPADHAPSDDAPSDDAPSDDTDHATTPAAGADHEGH
jgi:hypothetical protein